MSARVCVSGRKRRRETGENEKVMGEQKNQKTLTQSAFSHKTINPRQQESKQAKQLAEKHTSDSRTE